MKARIDPGLRDAIAFLFAASAGGFLAAPPGLDGRSGLGIAGITGVPRPRGPWDVVASAYAPDLPGDELTFTTFADGTVRVDTEVADGPDGAVLPLAEQVDRQLRPPYRAAALRHPIDDLWAVAAWSVTLLELPGVVGETLVASRVAGVVELVVDDLPRPLTPELLDALGRLAGDVAIQAEPVDAGLWAATVRRL